MKIHEEVDALEVMAVEPMRYLVATRVIACGVAIIPLYLIGLIGSYIASMLSVVVIFGQSPGQYDHYFSTFIQGRDVFLSVVKIIVFAIVITLLHCWYGMRVGGGPGPVVRADGVRNLHPHHEGRARTYQTSPPGTAYRVIQVKQYGTDFDIALDLRCPTEFE